MISLEMDIFSTIIDALMYFMLFDAFLTRRARFSNWCYGGMVVCLAVLFAFSNHLFNLTWQNILAMFLSALVISYFYESKLVARFMICIFGMIIGIATEIVVLYVLTYLFQCTVEEIVTIPSYRILGIIFSKIFGLAVCHGVRVKTQLRKIVDIRAYWMVCVLMVVSYVIVVYWFFRLSYELTIVSYNSITTICAICLFICMAFAVALFERLIRQHEAIREKEQYEQHLNIQLKHLDDMIAKQNELRKFKHDIVNQLHTLRGFFVHNDPDEGIRFIDILLHRVKQTSTAINTGNIALDAILNTKKAVAENRDIKFEWDIQLFQPLKMAPEDIGAVFGNALDNAIEACEPVENNKRFISISMVQSEEMLLCRIENSALYHKTATLKTSKKDKANHGYGLVNLTESLEKYGSVPIIERDDQTFSLSFVLSF